MPTLPSLLILNLSFDPEATINSGPAKVETGSISNAAPGPVVPMPTLPSDFIVNLSAPRVLNPSWFKAERNIPVSWSFPKAKDGEAAVPTPAKTEEAEAMPTISALTSGDVVPIPTLPLFSTNRVLLIEAAQPLISSKAAGDDSPIPTFPASVILNLSLEPEATRNNAETSPTISARAAGGGVPMPAVPAVGSITIPPKPPLPGVPLFAASWSG